MRDFFELIKAVMRINSVRGNLSTFTAIVLFFGTVIDVRSFFSRNILFQTSVVFLNADRTCVFLIFLMSSNIDDTM